MQINSVYDILWAMTYVPLAIFVSQSLLTTVATYRFSYVLTQSLKSLALFALGNTS